MKSEQRFDPAFVLEALDHQHSISPAGSAAQFLGRRVERMVVLPGERIGTLFHDLALGLLRK
ncbi:MAG TPA: hypothetical protein VF600_13380 [Abditibacteriaceae bacterium]